MSAERVERIRARLEQALSPERLEIRDDSAAHVGHAGARGGGHYSVLVVAEAFRGLSLRERHRAVYAALGENDSAFECLERSYKRHEEALLSLKVDPKVDPLRSDPRFVALLKKIGVER